MQIRCAHCTKTLLLAPDGGVPAACPHCAKPPGPGPLGMFEPLRLLACGGMGEVWLARHRELGTEVALKLLPAVPLDQLAGLRERFAREARLTARVPHPGVVKVHAVGEAGDRPFLVLEFIAGQTLRQLLRGGPLPTAAAARLVAATADVLAAAHAQGVLHRDIKPDNVMLQPDGAVRVLDFGIARALHDDAPLTRTGELLGTPEYMAPEQLLDGPEAITARTDVHALGVLAYELLTGRSPFRGANVFQTLKLVESLIPPPPSRLVADIPAALDAVVAQALAKAVEHRTPTAAAFAAAVRAAVPELALPSPPRSPARRHLLPLAATLALVAGGFGWWMRSPPGDSPLEPVPVATASEVVPGALAARLLREGQWNQAYVAAIATDDTASARDLAREAFVLAHVAWPLAVDAPAWLAAYDAARAVRFGDRAESATPGAAPRDDWYQALLGSAPGSARRIPSTAADARAELLAAHLAVRASGGPANAESAGQLADSDDALVRLLRIRTVPPQQRAAAFAAYAARLPLEASEHWLALMCAEHLRGQGAAATRAAEMAWLAGAGESAVLLDAYLAVAPLPGSTAWRPLEGTALEAGRHRVAGADATDTPARSLLLGFYDALHGIEPDLTTLRTIGSAVAADASRWFVAQAQARSAPAMPLLRLAATLGAVPDDARAPWSDLPPEHRAALHHEISLRSLRPRPKGARRRCAPTRRGPGGSIAGASSGARAWRVQHRGELQARQMPRASRGYAALAAHGR